MRAIRKFAEFVGYTLYHGEMFNAWRCPNKKCGFHVSEDCTCCPYCGQKIKFKEPPKVKVIKIYKILSGQHTEGKEENGTTAE